MLRKLMMLATPAALGLSLTLPSLAQGVFQASGVIEALSLRKMTLVTDDGQTYRLSPELIPEFDQQQRAGQLQKGTPIQIFGHYGRAPDGERVPYVERLKRVGR